MKNYNLLQSQEKSNLEIDINKIKIEDADIDQDNALGNIRLNNQKSTNEYSIKIDKKTLDTHKNYSGPSTIDMSVTRQQDSYVDKITMMSKHIKFMTEKKVSIPNLVDRLYKIDKQNGGNIHLTYEQYMIKLKEENI